MVVGLPFAIVVVWVCVLGWWLCGGYGFAFVGWWLFGGHGFWGLVMKVFRLWAWDVRWIWVAGDEGGPACVA